MSAESSDPIQGKVVSSRTSEPGAQPGSGAGLPGRLKQSILEERSGAFWIGTTFGALLAIATTLLIVQNSESADLDWLWFNFTAPLWLLLFLSALSGAILSRLIPPIWRRVRSRTATRGNGRSALRAP